MPSTPQRITRSMSHQPSPPPALGASTAPGPPVPRVPPDRSHSTNPFNVDFVIPFDISYGKDRVQSQAEVREGYEELLRALESQGLRVGSRPGRAGKGKEEVWVLVGAGDDRVEDLAKREA